ncbi:MAG: Hpt domain-containing protein [Alphaproteobacteria bacterium]|jgi:HPt (histidine-containing phosphotransfer) domain-containing protein|nr:Hpt domain-containing protein [Alphaproteobacteria bacterium]
MQAVMILDQPHLDAMTGGDVALQEELIGLFDTQAALWRRLFTVHAPLHTWRDAAHSCKGSAKGLGLWRLAAAAAAAEDLGREGLKEGPDVETALAHLRAELALAVDTLQAMRPRLSAANDA